ncbi:MAG: hypothetical protein H6Q14_2019 [Bacteroidetes bacterium]|jgi:hypothetical protein|nr:hypothetical protein [Bacteroidota bacterium]
MSSWSQILDSIKCKKDCRIRQSFFYEKAAPVESVKLRMTGFECFSPFVIRRVPEELSRRRRPAIRAKNLSRNCALFDEFRN